KVCLGVGEKEAVALTLLTAEALERPSVPPRDAVPRAVRLIERGQVDDARHGFRAAEHADADGPERETGDESGRPVDRIDDDAEWPPPLPDRSLLPEHADVREAPPELTHDMALHLAVRLRDQRAVGLPLRRHPPEAGECQRPGAHRHRLQLPAGRTLHGTFIARLVRG